MLSLPWSKPNKKMIRRIIVEFLLPTPIQYKPNKKIIRRKYMTKIAVSESAAMQKSSIGAN